MLFWNRIEIYSGFSLKEFSELRNALAIDGVDYDYKVADYGKDGLLVKPHKGYIPLNRNTNSEAQYNLYVHHKDYERAMYLTSNRHVLTR